MFVRLMQTAAMVWNAFVKSPDAPAL